MEDVYSSATNEDVSSGASTAVAGRGRLGNALHSSEGLARRYAQNYGRPRNAVTLRMTHPNA